MSKFSKLIAVIMASSMSLSLLAGCGSEKTDSSASATNSTAPGSTAASTEVQEPVKLTYYHWDSTDVTKTQLDGFKKANQNIDVELILTPNSEYTDKIRIVLAGGEKVDIYANANGATYVDVATKFKAVQLDEYIAKDKFDVSPFGNTLNYAKIDGKLLAMPLNKGAWMMYYNKKIFDDAKVPYPKDDMTWDEYAELAKQLTKGEGSNKIWGSFMTNWAQSWVMPQVQKGKTIFDDDLSAAKQGLELRVKMQNVDKSEMPWAEVTTGKIHHRDAFVSGKVAMTVIGDWLIGILNTYKAEGKFDFEYDITNPPHPEGVPAGTTIGGPSTFLSINGTSEHKDEAWKVIKYVSGKEGAMISAKAKGSPAYIDDEIISTFVGEKPEPASLDKFLKLNAIPQLPFAAGSADVDKIMGEEGELAFVGNQDASKAIENITKRRAEALAKYK